MQKVEKKKRGSGGRKSLRLATVFACFLLVLSIGAFAWMRRAAEEPAPQREETGGILFSSEPEEIQRVTIAIKAQEPWTMERIEKSSRTAETGEQADNAGIPAREEGEWLVTGTEKTADPEITDRITDALARLEYADVFTEDTSEYQERLEEFGLEDPKVTVNWFMKDGTEYRIRIGNAVEPAEGDCYFMLVEGDERLYGVDTGTLQDLSMEKAILFATPTLSIRKALLDRITVLDGDGQTAAEWRLNGQITDQDAGVNWRVTYPFEYAADEEMIGNLLENAGNLLLGSWVGWATEERLAECGLKAPLWTLEFHQAEGATGTVTESGVYDVQDWEEETVRLTIGAARGEMTDYVLYDGSVYTMTHFSLTPFTGADPMAMTARYPVLTPLNSLLTMTIERDGAGTDVYEIVRETSETEGETIQCLKNGTEIAYDAFDAAYQRLLVVTVSGTLPEDAKWGKAHTKYTFRTVSGGTHTVELSDFDGMHDAVTLDGQTMFYLIHGGMTELP